MIEIQNLQKVIENKTIIDIPSLFVQKGEIVSLIGAAGTGKELLFDLLIGKTRPTAGKILLAGIDPIVGREAFSRKVGVLFANDGHYVQRTVKQNLSFHARLQGISRETIQELLFRIGLADHSDVKIDKLSSGLSRRLAFGRAILNDINTLILMEPFLRCDDASMKLLSDLILDFAENDASILILSEDHRQIRQISEKVFLLDNGKIIQQIESPGDRKDTLPFLIPVRLEGKVALINPGDILFAEAVEGRVYLQTFSDRYPTQYTLTELEERLARSGFFRAHRAYLINLQHVKEVIPYTRNSFTIRLNDPDKTEIPLSKAAANELRALLDY